MIQYILPVTRKHLLCFCLETNISYTQFPISIFIFSMYMRDVPASVCLYIFQLCMLLDLYSNFSSLCRRIWSDKQLTQMAVGRSICQLLNKRFRTQTSVSHPPLCACCFIMEVGYVCVCSHACMCVATVTLSALIKPGLCYVVKLLCNFVIVKFKQWVEELSAVV